MRFSLRQLFGSLTIIGIGLGAYAWLEWYALVMIPAALAAEAWVLGLAKGRDAAIQGGGLSLLSLFLSSLFVVKSFTTDCRDTARQQLSCLNTMLALYHLDHGEYPPTITYDAYGQPMHSWRTYLAPYFDGGDKLQANYDWNDDWDGKYNSRLHNLPQHVFVSVFSRDRKAGESSYLAVVVPGAQPGDRFAIIEVPDSGVKFLEPRELQLTELLDPIHGPARIAKLPAEGRHSVNVMWPNGQVEDVEIDTLATRLRELVKTKH